MFKRVKVLFALLVAMIVSGVTSVTAFAAGPLTTAASSFSIDDGIAAVIAIFGVVILGLAVLWGIRKCIKTPNRS